jgi:vacuolar-type H+-ATPase subunit H
MGEPIDSPAARHERIARIMEETEERMHSTAEVLREPRRTRMHQRADAISRQAQGHHATARRLKAGEKGHPPAGDSASH